MVNKYFYNELDKIASLSDKQKKKSLYLGSSILSGLLMHRGYRHVFPKVSARGPMHSFHQNLTNEGRDVYTIGNQFVTDSKSRQRVINLSKNIKNLPSPIWLFSRINSTVVFLCLLDSLNKFFS